MTMSILDVLAVLPSGARAHSLTLDDLGGYLARTYDGERDRAREAQHRLREELYNDGGVAFMDSVVDDVFSDPEIAQLRKKWTRHSRYNNVYKRIINELSSVYSEPAKRKVGSDSEDKKYQDLLSEMQFDVLMQEVNRKFNAHRVLIVGPRVREFDDGEKDVVLDIVTPANFRVILHPNDNSRPVGWLTRTSFRPAREVTGRMPAWLLETSHESMMLDEKLKPIADTHKEHDTGSRWVALSRLPNRPGFYPGEEGEDLVAAAVTIWINAILQNKETKSANKQTVVAGDGTETARGQLMDTERPVEISDGQAISTVDMSMDVSIFRDNANHALESAANNYGMAASYMRHQGVQSAEARELMRVPLRELRRQQQPMFRLFERRLAERMSVILAAHEHPNAFAFEGWEINFGEAQTPLTPREELDLFEKERRLGLTDTIEFIRRRDPDKDSDEKAWAEILMHIDTETKRVKEMRELQAEQSGMGQRTPSVDMSDEAGDGEEEEDLEDQAA